MNTNLEPLQACLGPGAWSDGDRSTVAIVTVERKPVSIGRRIRVPRPRSGTRSSIDLAQCTVELEAGQQPAAQACLLCGRSMGGGYGHEHPLEHHWHDSIL